jgi:hypothetical protein
MRASFDLGKCLCFCPFAVPTQAIHFLCYFHRFVKECAQNPTQRCRHSIRSKGFHISQTTTNAEKCMHCWQRWRWQKAIFPNTRTIYGRRYNNARSPHANIQTQKGCSVRRRRRREKGITPRVLLLMRRRAGNAIGIPDKDCERPRGHYFIPLESKGDKKSFAVEQRKAKYPSEPAYQHPESTHSTQMAARDQ